MLAPASRLDVTRELTMILFGIHLAPITRERKVIGVHDNPTFPADHLMDSFDAVNGKS